MRRRAPFDIPASIKIRGKRWEIQRDCTIEDTMGITLRPSRRIKLAGGQSQRTEAATFIHELLHACAPREGVPHDYEEAFIREVERPLLLALEQLEWRPKRRK